MDGYVGFLERVLLAGLIYFYLRIKHEQFSTKNTQILLANMVTPGVSIKKSYYKIHWMIQLAWRKELRTLQLAAVAT